MNKSILTRGFTLIELLVVIAIIGILAAVVIGSLNDARSGGQDASVKQSVANIRSQAELYYNSNGYTYSGMCATDPVGNLLRGAINVVNGTPYAELTHGQTTSVSGNSATVAADRIAACHDSDITYVAVAPLASDAAEYWCVDSTGVSKAVTTALASGDVACPAS